MMTSCQLVTLHPEIARQLQDYPHQKPISTVGVYNASCNWLRVEGII
ncbi:MAG: hypothetical protein F6K24_21030 [Okeania sp. SIO2D1]|nr:hypothetical protein [Okeania sp. SIO2D1]